MNDLGRTRTRWAAIGAAVAVTLGGVALGGLNVANADVSSGDRPVFIAINPCRLVDTRPGDLNVGPQTTPIGAGDTVTVTAHGANGECTGASEIPTDALSLALNVTAVGPTDNTLLTCGADGPHPRTSNPNPRAGGAPTPNSVNTPLSATGTFNIFNNRGDVNVIVDVNGYYAHHDHDDRYYTKTESDAAVDAALATVSGAVETAVTAAVPAAVETAVDAATAPAPELLIGPAEFTPELGSQWRFEGSIFRSTDTSPSADCVRAPLRIAAGQTIERIGIPWLASSSVTLDVAVEGATFYTGTVISESDLGDVMINTTVTGGTPPELVVAEFAIEPSTPPVAAVDTAYHLELCSSSAITILPIKVEFG
ncbi:MAG: hypothetical protein AB8G14_15335 [Ilumatobacter sp.]